MTTQPVAVLLPHDCNKAEWYLSGVATHELETKVCDGLCAPHALYHDGSTRPLMRTVSHEAWAKQREQGG